MKKSTFFIIFFLNILCFSCIQTNTATFLPSEKQVLADSAMVVSAHPLASEVGANILRQGGNAVDAAVGLQFALAVVYPRAGNIGGGGFMIYRDKDGTSTTLDFREKAPKTASRDMYLDSKGDPTDKSRYGHLSVGVPGSVDGMFTAHAKYGKIQDFNTLLQPAIDLAEKGYYLTEKEASSLNEKKADFEKNNPEGCLFIKDSPWKKGDLFVQKDLAETLKRIRDKGRAGFYEGKTAALLVKEMQTATGIISLDDLKSYQSVWRKPIKGQYKNYEIISMPPPSSGGIALVQMLKMIEPYPIKSWGFQDARSIHVITESMRRAYADRAEHLGDPDYWTVPQAQLLDSGYLKSRMSTFEDKQASKSADVAAGTFEAPVESEETTHFSIVDTEGNAVSITTTLNSSYGSKVVVAGAGFILNNEMDDFSAKPGVPNLYGLIGKEANAIQPEKRMLSSMTPTIVTKEGQLNMVIGSPGGSTIITQVLQVFLNVAEYDMGMSDAIQAKRFHHQWLPDALYMEEGAFKDSTVQALERKGHTVKSRGAIGRFEGILVLPDGKLEGGADTRGDDDAEGF